MSAHVLDRPETILADMRTLADRLGKACLLWGRVPGGDDADEAHTHLTIAIDTLSGALSARDGYTEADARMDALRDMQDARRAAA